MRFFVLNTGGTLGMVGKPLRPAKSAAELFREIRLPRVKGSEVNITMVDFKLRQDSTNIMHEDRALMCAHIAEAYRGHDAFIILHGTDSLAETCAFIAIAFGQSLQKPVFVIGAQVPKGAPGSDANMQIDHTLRTAVTFVVDKVVGVYTLCGGRILDGTRVLKKDPVLRRAFRTPGRPLAGLVGRASIKVMQARRGNATIKKHGLKLDTRFEKNVATLIVSADTPPSVLLDIVYRGNIRGIILEGKGTGNFPDRCWNFGNGENFSWIDAIKAAVWANIPVGILSSFEDGQLDLDRYELGAKARTAGAIPLANLTQAMADVKFRMGLARFPKDMARIERFVATDVVGELLGDSTSQEPQTR